MYSLRPGKRVVLDSRLLSHKKSRSRWEAHLPYAFGLDPSARSFNLVFSGACELVFIHAGETWPQLCLHSSLAALLDQDEAEAHLSEAPHPPARSSVGPQHRGTPSRRRGKAPLPPHPSSSLPAHPPLLLRWSYTHPHPSATGIRSWSCWIQRRGRVGGSAWRDSGDGRGWRKRRPACGGATAPTWISHQPAPPCLLLRLDLALSLLFSYTGGPPCLLRVPHKLDE